MNTNQRPTPETDYAAFQARIVTPEFIGGTSHVVTTDFARRLERQRDEAREIAGRLAADLQAVIDGCVNPETALRRVIVDLAPIRKAVTDYETLSASWKK